MYRELKVWTYISSVVYEDEEYVLTKLSMSFIQEAYVKMMHVSISYFLYANVQMIEMLMLS